MDARAIVAKIAPVFVLRSMMMLLAFAVLKIAFGVPFQGSLPLVLADGVLCTVPRPTGEPRSR